MILGNCQNRRDRSEHRGFHLCLLDRVNLMTDSESGA